MRFISAFLFIFLLFPQIAFAQTFKTSTRSGARASSAAAIKQAAISNRTQKGIQRGDREIERRIASLNDLIIKINSLKKLSNSSKNTFSSQIQAQIDDLNSLKNKIDADTDIATLKTNVASIVQEYRIYVLYVPKMRILVAADKLGTTSDILTNYSATLSAKIDNAKSSGTDTTSEEQLLSEMNSNISSASAMYQKAVDLVTPLTPDGWPGNKTTLQEARADIQTGAQDLKNSLNEGIQIRRDLSGTSVSNNSSSESSSLK